MLIAEVYVFDSFYQNCINLQIFMIDDKFITQFYPNTHFKLVLLFQTVSRYPDCQVQNFYSNFEYIEIRNLQTSNKLKIQFFSNTIKFIDCKFFNSQEIVISASHILFQNTSFLDFKTKDTLIKIDKNKQLEEIQFISCNFYNITIEEQQIFISIKSQLQKILIKNLIIKQVKMINSQFIQFSSFDIFQVQFLDMIEIDCFHATVFSSDSLQHKSQVNLFNIQISHSSIYMSVFYMIDSQTEVKYLNLFICKIYYSQLFIVNNRVSLDTIRIQELTLNKSQIFLFRDEVSTMKLKDIQIQYSDFQATQSLIQIQAHTIILEQFILVNCIYTPPMNILNITAKLAQFKFLTMKDINPNQEFIYSLPIYLLYLDVKNITIYHAVFYQISLYNIQLLYVLSESAEISDITHQNFFLSGALGDSIIRLSLLNQGSILKMENLKIINIILKQLYQSSLIIILGNKEGMQYINNIIIKDVLSILQHQIFQCWNTNLQIENVNAQLSIYIGFMNQHHSKIKIKNYKQKNKEEKEFSNQNQPIFTIIDVKNSDYEMLAITESSFTYLSQPVMRLKQNVMVVIIIKNVQIYQYKGSENVFQFDVYYFSYESINLNESIYFIYMERVLIIDINRAINFLDCQFCEVILNKFQLVKTNLIIISQAFSRQVRINNIYIQDTQIYQYRQFFQFTDIIGYVFAQNIYLRNQSGSSIIFYFNEKINKITLENIYIDQCNNCSQLIKFNHVGLDNNCYLENLYIMESQFNSDLIKVEHKYSQALIITNMFIYNSKLFSLIGNSQQKSMWHFNLLFLINVSFDEQIQKEKVFFQNSYLLNATFNKSQISIIDQTMFLNNNQQIIQKPITLGFNQQHFFNSTQLDKNLYQVYFHNNQTFVYVPTGIPLSKFIYINPKTNQQERIYDDFIIFINLNTDDMTICSLQQSINNQQGNFSNINELNLKNGINIIDNFTFNMNPYLNYTFIQNDIICSNITLRFNIRTLPCQQGEYLYQNQCLICDIAKNYYSVAFKAQFCNIIDHRIEQLKVGKIKIRPGFWRPKSDSNQIEQCQNEVCQGGWTTGDDSCQSGYVGALCIECDIYNKRGQGKYAKQNDGCKLCEFNYQIIIKGILISLWLMLLGYLSYNTNKQITEQYLIFKLTKRNVADILMRQSTNQISIILKIFRNYIFYLYLLQDKLDFIDYNINLSLDFISNPNSQLKPQLDCLLVQYHFLEIHYLQLIFSIISPFYTLLLLYFIYLLLLKLKIIQFQFNLIIITIYSVYLFNQQLIFEKQILLLSFTTASNIQWINLNKQFQFNTRLHYNMIYYYILPSTILLILISVFILLILKTINKRSIKSTRYFGVLFTEYKVDLYYWEIFRIYQKYLILCVLYLFNQNIIFYLVQSYFAFMIFQQPYALKNLNYLEQKSIYILNCSLIIILILIEYSKPIRLIVFLIFNLFLTFDVLINLYQKARIQYKNQIIKGQQILIQKIPRAQRWINLQKSIKLQYNMEILKNFYKSKLNSKNMQINWNKMNIKANFETLQTEIEMIDIKK